MGKQDGLKPSLSHLRAYGPHFYPHMLGALETKYAGVWIIGHEGLNAGEDQIYTIPQISRRLLKLDF